MKKALIILSAVILLVVAAVMVLWIAFRSVGVNFQKQMSALTVSAVDLTKIPDGTFTGKQTVFPIDVEVRVSVKDHRITAIDLVKHQNGRGQGADVIPGRVVEKQSLNVDTVSGATYSSKVILKAIDNALTGAVK